MIRCQVTVSREAEITLYIAEPMTRSFHLKISLHAEYFTFVVFSFHAEGLSFFLDRVVCVIHKHNK